MLIKGFFFLNFLFYKSHKLNLNNLFFKKIFFNNYFLVKNKFLNNYFFFFKNIFKINNYFFIKCINLVLYSFFYKYINIIYFLVNNNYNFYFISENKNFNLFWIFSLKYLKKNLTKANFLRFLINFFKKNKIKLIIFTDYYFVNFLNFFKKLNIITAGIININYKLSFYNYPLFFQNNDIYNTYFLYNLSYDIYLLSQLNKYHNIIFNFFKNYYKLNKLLFIL